MPCHKISAKRKITASAPIRPSSSPITAKMKSVSGSGRKKSFCRLAPSPRPSSPPLPSAISECINWYPAPSRCCAGSRNASTRAWRTGERQTSAAAPAIPAELAAAIGQTGAPATSTTSEPMMPISAAVP